MGNLKKPAPGLLVCLTLAVPSWFLGHAFPVIGGPVFAILAGMFVAMIIGSRTVFQPGIAFTSKKILQYAVILLSFGLNLSQIAKVGLLYPLVRSGLHHHHDRYFVRCGCRRLPAL